MSDISKKILEIILAKNISYGELAEKTGIPKSALQRYATGQTEKIPIDRLEKIATAIGTTAAYLMGWEESATPTSGLNSKRTPTLTAKDERDIARDLEVVMDNLENAETLMFDGNPMSDEARESIRNAIELGLKTVKLLNKQTYTPRKYRKE